VLKNVKPENRGTSHAKAAKQEIPVCEQLLYAPPGKGQLVYLVHRELEKHLAEHEQGALDYRKQYQFVHKP
jgi:hypothetical protein